MRGNEGGTMNEFWLSEYCWRREQRDQLWEEAQERKEESRSRAAGAAGGCGVSPEVGEQSGLIPDKGGSF
jgi:hypothetical protein